MIDDLKDVNANYELFARTLPEDMFNIRFRFQDYHPENELLEISANDINISNNRYILLKPKEDIQLADEPDTDVYNSLDDPEGFAG